MIAGAAEEIHRVAAGQNRQFKEDHPRRSMPVVQRSIGRECNLWVDDDLSWNECVSQVLGPPSKLMLEDSDNKKGSEGGEGSDSDDADEGEDEQ